MALLTLDAFQLAPPSDFRDGTATLRISYTRDFIDSEGQAVQGLPFYQAVDCTVADGVVSIDEAPLYTTVDAQDPDPQGIGVLATLYTNNNTRKRNSIFCGMGTP